MQIMQASPYLLPLLLTAVLSVLLALLIWRRRHAPGAAPLAVLMCAVGLWALAYMLSLAGATLLSGRSRSWSRPCAQAAAARSAQSLVAPGL